MKKTILILGLLIIGACSLPTKSISYRRIERESQIDNLIGPFGRLSLLEDRIAKLESQYEYQTLIIESEQEKHLKRLEFALSTIREQLSTFELRLDSVESKIKDLI
jgi:hypothetical protein